MMRRHSPYNCEFNNPIFFIDPDGMMPIPGAGGSGLLVSDTKYLGTSDTSTGGFGSSVNVKGGDESTSAYVEKNGNISGAAYQSKFKQMSNDIAEMDVSLDGGGCPPGVDCSEGMQRGNAPIPIGDSSNLIGSATQIVSLNTPRFIGGAGGLEYIGGGGFIKATGLLKNAKIAGWIKNLISGGKATKKIQLID